MSKIIVKKDNLYGVMNEEGKIVIQPIYEDIRGFVNGLAAVCKDNMWGYIDERGNQIIDFLYSDTKDFSIHELAPVKLNKNNNSWTLVKSNGLLIENKSQYKYYNIYDFNPYGYAIARIYQGYCIIGKDGNPINDDIYSSLEYIEDQKIFIGDTMGNLCLIDIEGNPVIEPDDDYDAIYYPCNGLCQVDKDNNSGYINEDGSLAIPLKYELTYEFSDNGLAYVSFHNGKGGYINKKDEFVIEPIYESGTCFRFGKAAVSKDGEYIFIDESGRQSINGRFKYAGGFSACGLAKVELLDGTKGFIRPDGIIQFILKEDWDAEGFIGDKRITQLKIEGKTGLINNYGEIILEPNYDEIRLTIDAHLHPFLQDELWGYIDDYARIVIDNKYVKASEFSENNLAFVEFYDPQEEKILGAYINDKEEIVDYRLMDSFYMSFTHKYSTIYGFYNGLGLAEKREKTKILNSYGKEIISDNFSIRVRNDDILID